MTCAWPPRPALNRRGVVTAAWIDLRRSHPAVSRPADIGRLRPVALTLKLAEPAPLAVPARARRQPTRRVGQTEDRNPHSCVTMIRRPAG